jgi:hypothetical protein
MLADCHHGLTERVRGLLETAFRTVVMVDLSRPVIRLCNRFAV